MLGGRENEFDPDEFVNNEQKEAMKTNIDTLEKRAREAGL